MLIEEGKHPLPAIARSRLLVACGQRRGNPRNPALPSIQFAGTTSARAVVGLDIATHLAVATAARLTLSWNRREPPLPTLAD